MCELPYRDYVRCDFKSIVFSAREALFNHNSTLPYKSIEIGITLVSSVHVTNKIVTNFSCIVCYDFGFLRYLFLMVLNMEFYINNICIFC